MKPKVVISIVAMVVILPALLHAHGVRGKVGSGGKLTRYNC